ncbi:MAG: type 1 glutamine amidotransferase [Planctomycetota bacterium]|jgi:type 1 glutamine amidotransferase
MLRSIASALFLALFCVACGDAPPPMPPTPPTLVRVLIIDGQNNHNWKLTTEATKATLLASGRFEVTVATSPADRDAAEAWSAWTPDFAAYDVVFSNYNDGGKSLWSAPTKQALADFVHGGGGLVVVHAADNSSSDWPEFNRMIGVGGWGGRTPASGSHLRRTDGNWAADPAPDGASGSHGAQLAFVVESTDLAHPITDGLPTRWMHAKDELYDSLRGPCENVQVLASAYCPRTERHEPVAMTIAYGQGRVFHTPMGHVGSTDPVHCVGFQTLIARGTEWAATGLVSIPVPAAFPSAEDTSIVPPAEVAW